VNDERDDHSPLYARVEEQLAAAIAAGEFPVGSQLPAEDRLIERFAVSRTTIRTTIQHLARRGLVAISRGRGTFVTEPKITQELTELSGFVEDMDAVGRRATARVLRRAVVAATSDVAQKLSLRTNSPVVHISRVRLADGEPISFDETWLPRALGEKVMADDLETEPIFALLEEKYDTPLVEADYRLEATIADAAVARALGIRRGSPIFRIERTSYSAGHRPVDYERLHYRGDRVRFVTRLVRRSPRARPRSRRR
jgi:GntR family transcriptional regulator